MDLNKLAKKINESLDNITDEELQKYFPPDTKPKGWISIEDHLPMMYAEDIMKGCTEYKVKYKDGKEGISYVADHNIWYYDAKDRDITHWWND